MSTPSTVRSRVPRFAEAAVERARLTVVPRRVQKAPKVPFVSLVSALLVTGVVGLLLFNTHMQQASFVTTSMENQASVLSAKEESLQLQLDRLRDPQRVAARAKELGMVPAASPAFLRLDTGKVLGNPMAAEQAEAMRITSLPTVLPKSLRPDPVIVEIDRPKRTAVENSRDTGRGGPEAGDGSRTKNKQRSEQVAGRTR